MPRLLTIHANFDLLLQAQDLVISRPQAIAAGFTARAIQHRVTTCQWQMLLPGIYLVTKGEPNRRQMLIAAQLYTGGNSAIDANDACFWHRIEAVPLDGSLVHTVAPWGETARSTGFVVVRRTIAPISTVSSDRLRYVDPATAVIAASRLMSSERSVLAALSDAVQRGRATYDDLVRANIQGPPRNARWADNALEYIGAGARSAPEADFLALVAASPILPQPLCNALVRLPSGRVISPDALFVESATVHETNGRRAHSREDLFEDMQDRHDAMTDSELEVFHSPPRRLALRGREAIAQVERSYLRRKGRGLPPGVEIIAMAA